MTKAAEICHFHLHHPDCFDDNDDCLWIDDIENVGHHCCDHLDYCEHHDHHKHHQHHDHHDNHQHHDRHNMRMESSDNVDFLFSIVTQNWPLVCALAHY